MFGKLGCISFGGPAVHVALLEEAVVKRRQWLTREEFLDLLGATNLIPGPTALEMAAHVGYRRAGLLGLLAAGVAFSLPGVVATVVLAWAYVTYGGVEHIEPFLRGVKPAVVAIVFAAAYRLGKTAVTSWPLASIAVGVALASLAGLNEVGTLLIGAIVGAAFLRMIEGRPSVPSKPAAAILTGTVASAAAKPASAATILATVGGGACAAAVAVPLWQLGLYFLQIGAVLFGGGYVLVAYLHGGLVEQHRWLTQRQLLDAIAAGQMTPGPLVTTAAFVGYLLSPEWPVAGAALATAAIAAPGFVLVAATHRWIARLRRWPWAARFLDAVNAASIGLMAAVVVALAHATLTVWPFDWRAWLIALVCAAAFLAGRVSAVWIVLLGAVLGRLL